MRKAMIGLVVALGLVLGTAGMASAGEVNGNGKAIPGASNANSECAFSGLDTWDMLEGNPTGFDDDDLAMRGNQKHGYHGVQNYGMFVKAGYKAVVPSPGIACRGNGD